MERCRKAIHLRTGDRATDGAIAGWLERYGVDVVDCGDAFEACTLTLTQPEPSPDLALIGADWLAPDELAIISYFRETWPGVVIVVYGSAAATAGFEESPLALVCRSPDAVRRVLSEAPGTLLERSFEALRMQTPQDDGWRPRPVAPPADERHLHDKSMRMSRLMIEDAEHVAAELEPDDAKHDAEPPADDRAPAPAEILTPEELAALLNDDEP
jgi:hypothetical protein